MRAQRLDLGADVVALPDRGMVFIHPDLEYGEALGAVSKTLPGLHLETVVGLVEQVTPRPKRQRRSLLRHTALAGVVVYLAAALAFFLGPQSASAQAAFGEVWLSSMQRLGLTCERTGGGWTCLDQTSRVVRVDGYARPDASLYLVNQPERTTHVLVFETKAAAGRWADSHPQRSVTGRVAVW